MNLSAHKVPGKPEKSPQPNFNTPCASDLAIRFLLRRFAISPSVAATFAEINGLGRGVQQ